MTLDEQIEILENNAEFERKDGDLNSCLNFRQLAEWLKELRVYKSIFEDGSSDYEEVFYGYVRKRIYNEVYKK